MQEQNFEEEVRRKMAELSFPPSDPVWEKVEKEIRNKKERRRIFFWLLPLLLIPGLVYYIINNEDSTLLNGPAVTPSSNDKQLPLNPRQDRPSNPLPPVGNRSNITSLTQRPINEPAITKSKPPVPAVIYNKGTDHDDDSGVAKRTDSKINTFEKTGGAEILDRAADTSASGLLQQTIDKQPANATGQLNKNINFATEATDSARVETNPGDSLLIPLADTASASEIAQQKKGTKKRWNLSFNSSVGVAGVNTNALPDFNGGKSGIYQTAAFDNMLGTTASANAPRSNLRSVVLPDDPSKVRRNVGFSAGIGFNRKIKTRFGVSTGLQYTQISTLTTVGRKVESASSHPTDFYLNTSLATKDYLTRYHILELPFSFNWQVMPKTPFKLHAGISLGYLLTTNALQYNGVMNIYYLNKSLYKPVQLSALAGFDYTIMKNGRHSLSVGPKLQFQLSNLLKNKTYGQHHLYFAGIGSSFSL